MTPRAEKSNAPLRRDEKKAIKRRDELAAKHVAKGMSKDDAHARAEAESSSNPKRRR
jgi:hypothetical protein